MIYGYARISTKAQNIERQERNILAAYPEAVMVKEAYTGTTTDRPAWNKIRKKLRAGDTVVFDEVSRMSRNAAEGFELYKALFDQGISLVFLKEQHINTAVYKKAAAAGLEMTGTSVDLILEGVNKYLLAVAEEQIKIAFSQAQAEVDHLHTRTSEGMREAKLAGKQIGRKSGTTIETAKAKAAKKKILECSRSFNGSMTDSDLAKLLNISRNTLYKYKAELKNEPGQLPGQMRFA